MNRILVVRLGALGDLIHTVPAVAALRTAYPRARIDWLVDARYHGILDLVPVIDRRLVIGGAAWQGFAPTIRALRREQYDVALDFQGLIKSAALARSSGAGRVVGFGVRHLRERGARAFYTEAIEPSNESPNIVFKNLSLLRALGLEHVDVRAPLDVPRSAVVNDVRHALAADQSGRFAILNPGAAWPNKRWPAERFGALAGFMRDRFGMRSLALWGPAERDLARELSGASRGAAVVAPQTTVADVVALCASAALVVSGDTAPLHIAAAVGTPTVGIFGPTNPARNGSWRPDDVSVSRFEGCQCHHQRRCRIASDCIRDIAVDEVLAAVERRLARVTAATHA
jgi:lipopolysaccharide heptosyltransferase I